MEPVTYAAIEKDCSGGLIIEVFEESGKVDTDVVLLHGCLQCCMPNTVQGLLEVYEDMVEVLRVLEILLMEDSLVEDLLCGVSSCSETCLQQSSRSSNDLISMTLLGWLMRLIIQ